MDYFMPRWVRLLLSVVLAAALAVGLEWLGNIGAQQASLAWLQYARRGVGLINGLSYAAFILALLELIEKRRQIRRDARALGYKLLPEDVGTVIDKAYVPKIFSHLKGLPKEIQETRLAKLVEICATKYQTSNSVSEVSETMRTQLELEFNHLETSYSLIRYLVWAIPVLGFIGTVVGLSDALRFFGQTGEEWLGRITSSLAMAFDTTFVALVLAFLLTYVYHRVEREDEDLLNRISDYSLRNFIVRAYFPPTR